MTNFTFDPMKIAKDLLDENFQRDVELFDWEIVNDSIFAVKYEDNGCKHWAAIAYRIRNLNTKNGPRLVPDGYRKNVFGGAQGTHWYILDLHCDIHNFNWEDYR